MDIPNLGVFRLTETYTLRQYYDFKLSLLGSNGAVLNYPRYKSLKITKGWPDEIDIIPR